MNETSIFGCKISRSTFILSLPCNWNLIMFWVQPPIPKQSFKHDQDVDIGVEQNTVIRLSVDHMIFQIVPSLGILNSAMTCDTFVFWFQHLRSFRISGCITSMRLWLSAEGPDAPLCFQVPFSLQVSPKNTRY